MRSDHAYSRGKPAEEQATEADVYRCAPLCTHHAIMARLTAHSAPKQFPLLLKVEDVSETLLGTNNIYITVMERYPYPYMQPIPTYATHTHVCNPYLLFVRKSECRYELQEKCPD